MASIEKRIKKDGTVSYRVAIRNKINSIYETFDDLETAELFAKYKEKIMNDMNAFNIPEKNLFRISDAFKFKIEELKKNNCDKRNIKEFIYIMNICIDFFGKESYIVDIKPEHVKELYDHLESKKIRRGGNLNSNTGIIKNPSLNTIRRYLANLSSVFGFLQKKGILIENPVLPFMKNLKNKIQEQEIKEKEGSVLTGPKIQQ